MTRRFSTFKFTPVDVFVLIFVCLFFLAIAQLASSNSRDQERRTTCSRNLSVIGKAMQIYTNDYDGEYPRAGGRTTELSNKVADFMASNRFSAYGLDAKGNGGDATISSNLYLLVKYTEVSLKTFVCPGDSGITVFNPANEGAGNKSPVELWDFGEIPSRHCSYAYHMPYGLFPLTTKSEPDMAVAADRNPWITSATADAKNIRLFNPDGGREAVKAGNTVTHEDEGQNVLFVDGHVSFETTPSCGVNNDNIYTYWNGGDIRRGIYSTPIFAYAMNRLDSFLVNEPGTYKEITTIQSQAVNSSNLKQTSIVATLDCHMPEHQNVIWCSTFQMAWDKLKDDIIGEPIQILEAEELAARLNQAKVSQKDIEEKSYYATAGFVGKGIIEKIQTEMKKRFPSEPAPVFNENYKKLLNTILAYSYLSIDIGFEYPYYTYKRAFNFEDSNGVKTGVTAFCSQSDGEDQNLERVREQVDILYYEYGEQKGSDWFAVDLCRHTQPYQVILALVPVSDTLGETISNMEQKVSEFKSDPDYRKLCKLRPIDRLIVPDVLYKLTHHFSELEGKRIGNQPWRDQGYFILDAIQMFDFSLSRTGVVLKSMSFIGAPPGGGRIIEPRILYFNRPFLIYVKKRGSEHSPFFVMWVDNAELLNEF